VFEVEWFDSQASLIKKFLLTFYPKDNTIEMYDLKNKRMFLKRMESQGLSVQDLYIGSIVTVYYRQLKLVDYGDVFTRSKFDQTSQKSFAMIKPDIYTQTGKVIDAIYANGFNITKLKMSRFD
jgi:nucleoside-diphosphate kinase